MPRWILCTLLLCPLSACVNTASTDSVKALPKQTLQLSPGQTAVLPDDTTVRYIGVERDTRCLRVNVVCVSAGFAMAAFEIAAAGAHHTKPLLICLEIRGHSSANVANWQMQLLDLEFVDQAPPSPARATLRFVSLP